MAQVQEEWLANQKRAVEDQVQANARYRRTQAIQYVVWTGWVAMSMLQTAALLKIAEALGSHAK